jgi:hypothetical protein
VYDLHIHLGLTSLCTAGACLKSSVSVTSFAMIIVLFLSLKANQATVLLFSMNGFQKVYA